MIETNHPHADIADPAERVVHWLLGRTEQIEAETRTWDEQDWQIAQHATLVHGIAPLLAERLRSTTAWSALHPLLRDYLDEQQRFNRERIALVQADLDEVLQAAGDLTVMPLKGAILDRQFYPTSGLRPMADLDLLVPEEQSAAMHALLHKLGYRIHTKTPRHIEFQRGEQRVVSYTGEHPGNPRKIELHIGVSERMGSLEIDITDLLWENATRNRLGDAAAYLPSNTAFMIHLAIHTCHNLYFRRLRFVQLYDLALVATRLSSSDWHMLSGYIRQHRAGRFMAAPLILAEHFFGALIPADVRNTLISTLPKRLYQHIQSPLLKPFTALEQREISLMNRLLWYHPGVEQMQYVLYLLIPQLPFLQQRYPDLQDRPILLYLRHYVHLVRLNMRSFLKQARPLAKGSVASSARHK